MNGLERAARQALLRLGQGERAITCTAFLVLVVVLFGDVISRETTGAGIVWARQVGVYANLFLTLVGIGIASADGAHLRPRFADGWLPESWHQVLSRVQDLLLSIFCLAFAAVAAAAVAETRLLGERTATPGWLVWPFQAVIPAVFLVASFRHAVFAAFPCLAPRTVQSGATDVDAGAAGSEVR